MEDFLVEHGHLIISGIVAVLSLTIIAQIIWLTGQITMCGFDQVLGVSM